MRDDVRVFAEDMEKVLSENDYKGGWDICSDNYLAEKLIEEMMELLTAMGFKWFQILDVAILWLAHVSIDKKGKVIKEAADVANIAMMISSNFKRGK